jgi:hypothetical protein
MPLCVFWDDPEKTILRCESEGRWTWEEYHAALEQVRDMISSVDHRVDLINGERPGAIMPSGSVLTHFQRASKILPPNLGANVIVIKSSMARTMAAVFSKMPGNNIDKVKLTNSLEDAYTFIRRERAKIRQQL